MLESKSWCVCMVECACSFVVENHVFLDDFEVAKIAKLQNAAVFNSVGAQFGLFGQFPVLPILTTLHSHGKLDFALSECDTHSPLGKA